jgi:hypothetical protein
VDAAKEKLSRRGAMKAFALWVGAVVFGAPVAQADKKEKKPIDEKHPSAVALGYAHQAKNADKKKGQIQAYQNAGENCSKCIFFSPSSDPKWGECKLLTQGLVSAEGLCMSFAKKS